MNKLITNLTIVASALEYFDRKTSGAWRVRACITNMLVWSANRHAYALTTDNADNVARSAIELATLRIWARDVNSTSLSLDFTPPAVRKTLGLDRVVDAHTEASRLARNRCLQSRSAAKFKDFYKDAMLALEAQRARKEEMVEVISDLLADTDFVPTFEVADVMRTFYQIDCAPGDCLDDRELYDESFVEEKSDQLAECLANALTRMHEVCELELNAAITVDKVSRLTAYAESIRQMMDVVGIDSKKLAARTAALEAQLKAAEDFELKATEAIDADIANLAELPTEPAKPVNGTAQVRVIKSPERLRREAEEQAALLAKREADEKAAKAAQVKADRALKAKANRERKAEALKATCLADIRNVLTTPADTSITVQ